MHSVRSILLCSLVLLQYSFAQNSTAVPSPNGPAPSPNVPAPSPNVPAPSPNAPAPSPNAPAPSPNAPAPSPNAPAPSPNAPAPSPNAPSPSPNAPSPSPNAPAPGSNSPAPSPNAPGPNPAPGSNPGPSPPTPSSSPRPGTPSKPATTTAESSSLSTGAIVGIAVGSIVAVVLAVVGVLYCLKRRREEDEKVETPEYQAATSYNSRKATGESQTAYIAASRSNASTSHVQTSPSALSSSGTVLAAPSNPPNVARQASAASSAGPSDDFSRAQEQFYAKQTSPAGSYARDTIRFSDARGSEYVESTVAPGAQDWWNAMERRSETTRASNNHQAGKPSLHQFSDADDISSRGSYEL